ncbi:hypothetical protein ACYSNX_12000 [Myroides sp. LJL115]
MNRRVVFLYVLAVVTGLFIIGYSSVLFQEYNKNQGLVFSNFYGIIGMLFILSGVIYSIYVEKHKNKG